VTTLDRLLPALRVLGFLGSLAIVTAVAVQAGGELDPAELTAWPLALALVLVGIWWLLLAWGWGVLLTGTAQRADIGTWCKTQALRYLPGGFWAPAARVVVVRGRMFDRLATVAAENVIALCAALALGGVALAVSGRIWWLPVALVIALPTAASRLLASRTRVAPERVTPAAAGYALGFAAYAGAAVLVQASVSGFHDSAAVAGAALVAWGVGLVVVIAPGGVGVREVAYVGLLGATFGHSELAAGALALRVITIIAELVILVAVARPVANPAPG